jgi:tetratricopeptide (TPR) repeat protein
MLKRLVLILFILKSFGSQAQDLTPIASYSFDSDIFYQNQVESLINIYEQTKAIKTLDSIVRLCFIYKDWETSIDYAKKAIEVNPTAERYFILGGASGFRALEVHILSSLKYVNIMKPAFEQAVRLEPMNVKYLRAQVDVLLSLPIILGGSINKAKQHIKKIKSLNTVEGFLAEGSMHEINEDFYRAKQVYKQLFDFLNQNYSFCSLSTIKYDRRNFAYDLGRIVADFELELKWGQCALSYFTRTYDQRDTIPLAWVYYQSARLAKRLKNTEQMDFLISKALLNLKESPDQILQSLLKELNL